MKGKKSILMLGMPIGFALAGAMIYMQVAGASAAPPTVPDPSPGQQGIMLALETKVVNLTPGGAYKYLKIGLTIELRPEKADFYLLKGEARKVVEEEAHKEWEAVTPHFLDKLGQSIAARTSDELATPEGRAGLKKELLHAFREVAGEEEVIAVYFTDFVMQ